MKKTLNIYNWIIYSTIVNIYFDKVVAGFFYIIELKYYFFIVLFNFLILLSIGKLKIPKLFVLFVIFIFSIGALSAFVGINEFERLVLQTIGILGFAIYHYSFFYYQKMGVKKIFEIYTNIAFFMACLGILMFLYDLFTLTLTTGLISRPKGMQKEPYLFATIMMPAFYFYLKMSITEKKNKFRTCIVFMSIVLSQSSVGYIGVLCSFLFLNKKILSLKNVIAYSVAIAFFFIGYNYVEDFSSRVDDTTSVYKEKSLTDEINISSYSITSNAFIASKSFLRNPISGSGLGSHGLSHETYIQELPGVGLFIERGYYKMNYNDASSLLLRVMSELGLIGLLGIVYFIYKFAVTDDSIHGIISKSIIIYFILVLLRNGHYYSSGLFFFGMMYVFNYWEMKRYTYKYAVVKKNEIYGKSGLALNGVN